MPPGSRHLLREIRRLLAPRAAGPDSDAVLLRRFVRDRDEAAFAALLARHGPLVLAVCRRVLRNTADAEDAFQATFLVFARKASSIRRPNALAAWLYGTARQVALRCRRSDGRRRSLEAQAVRTASVQQQADLFDELSVRELLAVIDEEVQRLPEVYRLPVLICCFEGLSQEETARRLNWTVGSVKGRLERGRAKLHARLVRRGVTLSAGLAAVEVSRGMAAPFARAPLLVSTAEAAALFAARKVLPAGMISARVAVLTRGALQTMLMNRTKTATAALLAVVVLGLATGILVYEVLAQTPPQLDSKLPVSPPAIPADARGPEVEAQMMVTKKEPPIARDGGDSFLPDDIIATHMVLLKNPLILGRAAHFLETSKKLQKLPSFRGQDTVTLMMKSLRVSHVRSDSVPTRIISLSYRGATVEESGIVLEAIFESYRQYLADLYMNDGDRNARRELENKLDSLQNQYLEFQRQSRLVSAESLHRRLGALEARREELQLRQLDLGERVAGLTRAVQDEPRRPVIVLLVADWSAKSGFDKLPDDVKKGLDPLKVYIDFLQKELEDSHRTEKVLEQIIMKEQASLRERVAYDIQDKKMRKQVEMTELMLDDILKKIQEADTYPNRHGYEPQWVLPPTLRE